MTAVDKIIRTELCLKHHEENQCCGSIVDHGGYRRLAELDAISCFHKVACLNDIVSAFLLAMCNESPYKNDNFDWFFRRYSRFIYVDRVVVLSGSRGQRLGSFLYEDLFSHARSNAIPLVACEYNVVPRTNRRGCFMTSSALRRRGLSGWQTVPSKSHCRLRRPNRFEVRRNSQ